MVHKDGTVMGEALTRAGVVGPEQRLRDIAIKAMVAHADNTRATVEMIWGEVQEDRRLMAWLFRFAYHNEISALLNRTRSDLGYRQRTGEKLRPLERKAAVVVNHLNELDRQIEARHRQEERDHQAKQDQEYAEYLAQWRKTKIGSLEIDGRFVWQNSAATVRAWLVTQKRQWRTVELLIEGLPDDDRPIEYYRRPDEVAALWAQAGV